MEKRETHLIDPVLRDHFPGNELELAAAPLETPAVRVVEDHAFELAEAHQIAVHGLGGDYGDLAELELEEGESSASFGLKNGHSSFI